MKMSVKCYSGYKGEETPRSFDMGDNSVEVKEILDQWLSPDHRYFKIRGNDDALYILRHDVVAFTWELTFYRQAD